MIWRALVSRLLVRAIWRVQVAQVCPAQQKTSIESRQTFAYSTTPFQKAYSAKAGQQPLWRAKTALSRNRPQMTRIKRMNTDQISEHPPHLRHLWSILPKIEMALMIRQAVASWCGCRSDRYRSPYRTNDPLPQPFDFPALSTNRRRLRYPLFA